MRESARAASRWDDPALFELAFDAAPALSIGTVAQETVEGEPMNRARGPWQWGVAQAFCALLFSARVLSLFSTVEALEPVRRTAPFEGLCARPLSQPHCGCSDKNKEGGGA